MSSKPPIRVPLFPLAGPLHIFEPRYQEMVRDALAGAGRIALIQPQMTEGEDGGHPSLYRVGCIGELVGVEELDDGRLVAPLPQDAVGTPPKSPPPARLAKAPTLDRGWNGPPNGPERAQILGASWLTTMRLF